MPDLIKFAYIPKSERRINADIQTHQGKERAGSSDYSAYSAGVLQEDEHVLILDFAELGKPRARREDQFVILPLPLHALLTVWGRTDTPYSMPPSLTPAALKKLIEKRNERFAKAVDEYGLQVVAWIYQLMYLEVVGSNTYRRITSGDITSGFP